MEIVWVTGSTYDRMCSSNDMGNEEMLSGSSRNEPSDFFDRNDIGDGVRTVDVDCTRENIDSALLDELDVEGAGDAVRERL